MPSITKITEQKRRANRRNVFLDGAFAFGVNLNVVAKFRLREGMTLSEAQVSEIQRGEVRQECFDKAMQYLQMRLHSRAELGKKLMRREYGQAVVDGVLDDLVRLGYLNDEQFARTKALSASEHKHHGRRRAKIELLKSGIRGEVAERALDDVFAHTDSSANATLLARKQAPRLKKLDPAVARRRLVGMLQRRGFDYETIKPVVDQVLGEGREADGEPSGLD
ncbi:MAG: regulatory protein RecX [Phycisphaerales bacterium]|jgi:regulatory protein|nr:regulatory protein RecX [Phycisphaerales bacterium]